MQVFRNIILRPKFLQTEENGTVRVKRAVRRDNALCLSSSWWWPERWSQDEACIRGMMKRKHKALSLRTLRRSVSRLQKSGSHTEYHMLY